MSDKARERLTWWINTFTNCVFKTPPSEQEALLYKFDKDIFEVVSLAAYQSVCEERDELKAMFARLNEHILPGEFDSVDSLRALYKERDEARAEVKRLKEYQRSLSAALEQNLMNNDEMGCEFVYVNTMKDLLAAERAKSRMLLDALNAIETAGIYDSREELQARAQRALADYGGEGK